MASTIFTPQNPSPRNEVRDMLLNQIFSVVIDGVRCTDYQIRIYRVSDNGLVFDSTKLTLGTPLADGEILEYTLTGGSITNTGIDSYKWTVEVWNDAESVVSREFQFFAKTTPDLTFNPPATITTQSYEFTATLTQAEDDIVANYTFELYDSNDELIEDSGLITSFNIKHTFEGFTNGDTFKVRLFGTTTGNDTFDSGLFSFDVSYSVLDLGLVPETTVDNDNGIVTTRRPEVVQIIGSTNGSVTFDDFFYAGMKYVDIPNASTYVNFDANIPLDFTLKFMAFPNLPYDFEGKLIQLDDGVYEVGYELNRFYWIINGVKVYTTIVDLQADRIFYIFLLPTEAIVKYIDV